MYTGVKHLHSYFPYLIFALLIISVIVFFAKAAQHKSFTKSDKSLALITMTLVQLQFVVGLVLYFISPVVKAALKSGEVMSNAANRFYAVEHIATMIIAVALVSIGYSKAKRTDGDSKKFRTLAIFYLLGLLLALLRTPWDVWPH